MGTYDNNIRVTCNVSCKYRSQSTLALLETHSFRLTKSSLAMRQVPPSTTTFSSASRSSLVSMMKRGWPLHFSKIAVARERGILVTSRTAHTRLEVSVFESSRRCRHSERGEFRSHVEIFFAVLSLVAGRCPSIRRRFLSKEPKTVLSTLQVWMLSECALSLSRRAKVEMGVDR